MRKLPHYMDHGFHKADRNHYEGNKNFDANWNKINWGETKGVIEEKKDGYTRISFKGGKE